MNRSEFCALLREKTKECKVAVSANIFRLEKRNFKIGDILSYLRCIGIEMHIDGRWVRSESLIKEYFSCLSKIEGGVSIRQGSLAVLKQKDKQMTIDVFLEYCAALKCLVGFERSSFDDSMGMAKEVRRVGFGDMLKKCRLSARKTLKEVSFKMNIAESNIKRYETGSHNYKVSKCLEYVDAIAHTFYIDGESFEDSVEIAKFLSSIKKTKFVKKIHELIGVAAVTVFNMETGKTELTIDTLLAYCRVLDIKIEIRPKETVTLVGGNEANINE